VKEESKGLVQSAEDKASESVNAAQEKVQQAKEQTASALQQVLITKVHERILIKIHEQRDCMPRFKSHSIVGFTLLCMYMCVSV
jgi:protoporphyrinogen oxidase